MKPRHAAALAIVGCLLSVSVLLFDGFATAGGDWSPVRVETLTLLSDTDYVLVVSPVEVAYSSFPKACAHFEVHGTFSRLDHLHWFEPASSGGGPTKKEHLAAIRYLREFVGSATIINLGEMGYGLSVDSKNPCVAESRALELLEPPYSSAVAVVSYYNRI